MRFARKVMLAALFGTLVFGLAAGCLSAAEFLNPEFVSSLGAARVATLPGQVPGLLVKVENRTSHWIEITLSYRDSDDTVQDFTTALAPHGMTGQMLICPVSAITVGSLSNREVSGARVALTDEAAGIGDGVPFVDVDPFGRVLEEGINYDCGDELLFVVEPAAEMSSGYRSLVYHRAS